MFKKKRKRKSMRFIEGTPCLDAQKEEENNMRIIEGTPCLDVQQKEEEQVCDSLKEVLVWMFKKNKKKSAIH